MKSCGQGVEQGRVDGRVGAADVVDRIDDAAMEEVAPDAIDQAAGEERVVRRRQPARIGFAAIDVDGQRRLAASQEPRRLRLARAWVGGRARPSRLSCTSLLLGTLDKRTSGLRAHLVEEAGQAVVVGLRPVLQRMRMAAGTEHAHAAENLRDALDACRWCPC